MCFRRAALVTGLFLGLSLHGQNPQAPAKEPPPQTARQAIIEILTAKDPAQVTRHLPDNVLAVLQKGRMGASMLAGLGSFGAQFAAQGQKMETFEDGLTLMAVENTRAHTRFEVNVEMDDLRSDEDQIELSLHSYKNGQPEQLPVIPRITVIMKQETKVWRINDVTVALRVPLGDEDYLNGLMKQMKHEQMRANEIMATMSIHTIVMAEKGYSASHPGRGFTCSLSELAAAKADDKEKTPLLDAQLASGKNEGYVFKLSGCGTPPVSNFQVTAEPETKDDGVRAFCSDESGSVRYSLSGRGDSCLSSGTTWEQGKTTEDFLQQ